MIGVIADSAKQDVVHEFFELFKTPWEFYRENRRYDVLLSARDGEFDGRSKLALIYAGRKTRFDDEEKVLTRSQGRSARSLTCQGNSIPIYGGSVTFPEKASGLLKDDESHECAAYLNQSKERGVARIGYDLFDEVRTLLALGQPRAQANIPTLELHIAFLRDLIIGCGVPLVEIPPVPDGYRFIACLTHDVDHPSIRQHKWDHTAFGFLFRAVFSSLHNLLRGRLSFRSLVMNWAAVLKLPFVHLGLAKDFWRDFDHRYLQLEDGLRSTFFVIPFKNHPGKDCRGSAPRFRAAHYGVQDLADTIRRLAANGCEIGLHGIDAWRDSLRGREELEQVRRYAGVSEIGVRMHWLYYDQESPAVLEKAGAAYDSTVGYNETAGYRAGTTQVYKPLQTNRLLELPMHVMDTALLYPDYLGLSPQQAKALLGQMIDTAVHYGGCLTINWHDRSIVPERLWGTLYRDIVQDLRSRDAWFPTAGQAIRWFRKRRSAVFETDSREPGAIRVQIAADHDDNLPGLRLRVHKGRESGAITTQVSESYIDRAFDESVEVSVFCGAKG